jgi:type VI secretion system protein ImpH
MADHDRRQGRSLEALLYRDPARFSFLQAVRLLEDIAHYDDALRAGVAGRTTRTSRAPGETMHYEQELVFFRHKIRFDNPNTDVEALEPGVDQKPPRMTVNIMGLAGLFGPLPQTVTQLILDELRNGYRSFAEFLDIFNHRLISLLYRAHKKYRPALDSQSPHDGRMARVLYAIIGLGTPSLRGRVLRQPPAPDPVIGAPNPANRDRRRAQTDRAMLAYAGLLTDRYRSPVGLKRIVEDHFDVKAEIVPFIGAWETLDKDDITTIGARSGSNNRLGDSALLGARVWNQAARFEVRIGPLDFTRFLSFLPDRNGANIYVPRISVNPANGKRVENWPAHLRTDASKLTALTPRTKYKRKKNYFIWCDESPGRPATRYLVDKTGTPQYLIEQNDAFHPLVSLIRFYAREELGFSIRLVIARDQIPKLQIGRSYEAYLGHTTWLPSRKPLAGHDHQVRLVGQR